MSPLYELHFPISNKGSSKGSDPQAKVGRGNWIYVSISTKVQTGLPRDQRPTKPVNRLVAGRVG